MDEFGAELDRQADPRLTAREDAAAQPIAGLQHADGAGMLAELGSGHQAGGAGAHDQGVEHFSVGHAAATMAHYAPPTPTPGRFVPQQ